MSIKKIAFSDQLQISNIVSADSLREEADIVSRFKDIIASLRDEQERIKVGTKIAPKMEDFLYCHAIQMHAAEANLVDDSSGEFRKNARGEPVRGHFESVKDTRGSASVKWVSPDGVQLYKNQNGDIFPEEDLVKSHKDWVGKPLCKDHISSTVDGIRGIIVDTFYDPKLKRVHALFALDRKNYPDLARKVEAGYATNVSMGTAVGRSICTECANVATTEAEYCHHVKTKANYGEINKDLKPIELSLVVTGADPKAKVRTVLASFNNYFMQKAAALADGVDTVEGADAPLRNLSVSEVLDLLGTLNQESPKYAMLVQHISTMNTPEIRELVFKLKSLKDPALTSVKEAVGELLADRYMSSDTPAIDVSSVGRPTGTTTQPDMGSAAATGHDMAGQSLNDEVGQDPTSMVDKNVGVSRTLPDPNSGIATASATSSNFSDDSDAGANKNSLHNRFAMLKNKEIPMNFAELRKRAEARKQAYHQGTEDPTKVLPYDKMGDADKIRDTQDKQMTGQELDTSKDIPAEDAKKKEMLQRASLEERRLKRARLLESLTKAATDGKPGSVEEKTDSMGRKVQVATKADGTKEVLKADDKEGVEKKAYWQGTEEPTPGKTKYPLMGDSHDSMRMKDKHMNGNVETGADGMFPGDEQKKRGLQRMAAIRAQLTKSATPGRSAWKFFSGNNEILTVRASSAYEVGLDEPVQNTAHLSPEGKDLLADDFFKTEAYAKEVMKLIRAAGLDKAAETLGGELPPPPAGPAPGPEAPAAEPAAKDEGKDKISEALASIESAVEEIRNAANIEDLKQVDVAVDGAPVTASFRTQILKVQAELAEVADELGALSTTSVPAAVVDEAISDAFVVATAAANLLDKFAAKKKEDEKKGKKGKDKDKDDKKKPKKKADEDEDEDEDEVVKGKKGKEVKKKAEATLAALLAARAARREALVARAFSEGGDEGEWEDKTKPEIPSMMDTVEEDTDETVDDALSAAEELEEALRAWDAEDAAMAAKDAGSVDGPLNKAEEKEVAEIAEDKVDEEVGEHEKEMHAQDSLMDRKAWRQSLLKKIAGEWQSTYSETRKGPGPDVSVDAKVSDKLNKVETLAEVKQAIEEVAKSEPRNVRMAAETLDKMIRAGVVKAAQLDELVSKGAVDAEAAKYWREFFGQVDGGREFATGLTQEFKHSKAGLEVKASAEEYEAKLLRAYNLALEAQERGVIAKSRAELHRFASNLVKLPNEQFDAMKNMVGQARKVEDQVKTAAPVAGMNYDRPSSAQTQAQTADVSVENLSKLFF